MVRCLEVLQVISLGKYQTTFYNRHGSAFQSSALGGLITLVAVGAISVAIMYQLVYVFSMKHYNLDIYSEKIQAY